MDSLLKNIRTTTWPVLMLAIVVCVGASWLVNLVVGPVKGNVRYAQDIVGRATGGQVQPPLGVAIWWIADFHVCSVRTVIRYHG